MSRDYVADAAGIPLLEDRLFRLGGNGDDQDSLKWVHGYRLQREPTTSACLLGSAMKSIERRRHLDLVYQ